MRKNSTWVDRNLKGHIEESRIDRFTISLVTFPQIQAAQHGERQVLHGRRRLK